MQRKPILFLVLIFLLSFQIGKADGGKAGYAGAFLQLTHQARAAGMGGAFVGISDDASAHLSNPAGSFQVRKRTLVATYRKLDLDRKLGWVGYLQPVRKEASIGISWINVGVDEVYERDDRGEIGEEISDYQNAVTFNFARQMSQEIILGVNIKYVQHNLANLSSYGVGFDFGIFALPVSRLRMGFAVQNVGLKYTWSSGGYWKKFNELGTSTKDEFPVNFKVGASWMELKNRLLTSIEVEKDNHQDAKFKAGAEYWVVDRLAGRIGYNGSVLTFGIGLRQEFKKLNFGLDYAYLSDEVGIDSDHIVSIECSF